MALISDEKHPFDAPMSITDLRSFVSRISKAAPMSKPKSERDSLKGRLRAQLFYQDIKFSDRTTLPTLVKLLCAAVKEDKCHSSARRIVEYQRRKQEEQRLKDEAWHKCKTPGERATEDLDRFMEHYFLTDGRPDRSKTTEPLALHGFNNRSQVHARAEHIPGLETTSGGEEPERTVCIGWNRSAVWSLAGTIGAKARAEKAKAQEDEWEDIMEEHRAFVKGLEKRKAPVKLNGQKRLEKCRGSYVVRCDGITDEWDNCDALMLDIASGPRNGILIAAVDFGMIEGTMLLAFDDADLDAYIDAADEEDENDTEGSDVEDEYVFQEASKKRKVAANTKSPKPARGRGRPKKQARTIPSSNHLFFRLRGRETGEGQIFYKAEKGYLDFTDNQFVAFKGIGGFPYVGSKVPFEGFKISAEAASKASSWETYSEAAYDRECVSRWH